MAERIYRKLEGMGLEYVSGRLEQNTKERTIGYTVTFEMDLDFTHFKQMANAYIPNYLDNPINAIRPELDGLAHHYSYNYLFSEAGNIGGNQALFELFASPGYYNDQWATGPYRQVRYGKPEFVQVGQKLRVTARRDFRSLDDTRQIEIGDLPVIQFHWALNLLQGEVTVPGVIAPVTKVVLMYMGEDLVEVEGEELFLGTLYVDRNRLGFGDIAPDQILTAK
ncbi:hypothetical protein [Pseudomonas sp. NPDC087614]|uniref:hypothetical protein n=1 Tax=Pseudomonas sp. NPDC087614 TaxID=3364442 RepID=UPI0038022FC7